MHQQPAQQIRLWLQLVFTPTCDLCTVPVKPAQRSEMFLAWFVDVLGCQFPSQCPFLGVLTHELHAHVTTN